MRRLGDWLIRLLRAGLALAALALVLLALYVSVGRELTPLVAEYHAEIERRGSEALGLPLRIGRLQGEWSGLAPRLVARDVQLGEGDELLQLERIAVVPAVLDSLLARAPRLRHLELSGLHLVLREGAEGRWQVDGLPRPKASGGSDPRQLLAVLGWVQHLSLLDSQLTLQRAHAAPLSFTYLGFTLHSGRRLHLDAQLRLPDGQPLAAQLRVLPNLDDWRRSPAELYLSLPQSDWARWLPAEWLGAWRIEELLGGGELWLDWRGRLERGVARLHLPSVKAGHASYKPQQFSEVGFTAHFSHTPAGYRFVLEELGLDYRERRWGPALLAVEHQHETDEVQPEWRISADRLDLAPIAHAVNALAPLPEAAREVLLTLQPQGALRNLQLDWRPQREGAKRLEFAANLERIGVQAWHGAPAAQNVSGSVQGDLARGELRLGAEDFGLHFPTLFPELWRYRQANARLEWALDEQGLTLESPYLRLEGEEGELAGDFSVQLRKDPAAEDYMDLRVGLRNGDARAAKRYLPTRSPGLSPALAKWLQQAIVGARIEEGFFEYQGSLMKGAEPTATSIGLYFKVDQAELDYQSGWPALREGRGQVWVEDSGVQVRLDSGRLLDSRVRSARASVPSMPGQVPRLKLQAQLDSSVEDGLRVLREAPIDAQTFAQWLGSGALDVALDLDIPLAAGQTPGIKVDWRADGVRLKVPQPALDIEQIRGAFSFDLAKGLAAPAVSARLLEHEVRGKILAEGGAGKQRSRFDLQGTAPLKPLLAWLGQSGPLPISGSLPYQLQINLEGADSLLKLESDLRGLAIELPAPFGKSADERRPSSLRMTLDGAQKRYQLDQSGLLSLVAQVPSADPAKGSAELVLGGGKASLPVANQLRVRGRLAEFDLEAWQAALKPYLSGAGKPFWQPDVQLSLGLFRGLGLEQQSVRVALGRQAAAWQLDMEAPLLAGRLQLPDAAAQPWALRLSRLDLPRQNETADKPPQPPRDPLQDVDPRRLPAMDVAIDQVSLGGQPLGAWRFNSRQTAEGVRFEAIELQLKGMTLGGALDWVRTPGGQLQSHYQGRLQGQNLAEVLKAWDYAPSVSSERFRVDLTGHWPGSPAFFGLERYSGSLDASLRKGMLADVQGGANALRVFGLLNFNSISRRLRLDFSDLLGKGLAYDRVKTRLQGSSGVFVTEEPLRVESPSTLLELNGTLDMARDRVNAELLVSLPVSNNLPLAALIAGAPAIGGALFVVDKLLGDRATRMASVKYHVSGPWQNPQISFLKPDQAKP